jgi:two-component system, chemotaxis family, chemotaxis protein CheY
MPQRKPAGGEPAGLQVLIVDDNEHMRTILQAMLRSLGVQRLREASDGAEAFEILKEWAADLVIVDFRMAPVDGVTFARRVRSPESPNRNLPIMMLTGHSEATRVAEARDAGVNEFIAKPLSPRILVQRLNSVVTQERPFIEAPDYYGPDRRRRADPEFKGPFRRQTDT